MAVEYTWNFGPMRTETVDGLANVVTKIHWLCVARDPENRPDIIGYEMNWMDAPPVNAVSYVTLENLTADVINSWITNGALDKAAIEQESLENLNKRLNPGYQLVGVPNGLNSGPGDFTQIVSVMDPETQMPWFLPNQTPLEG